MTTVWLTPAEAAEYVRYSETSFRRYRKKYAIPAHGPEASRFHRDDLDRWLKNPNCFLDENKPKAKAKRPAGGFRRVKALC